MLQISYICENLSVLDGRRGTGQSVSQVEPNRVLMRVLRSPRGHVPRIAEEVSILEHHLHSSILAVPPERLRKSDAAFLSGFVLAVVRSPVAITNQRRPIGIQGRIPS